MDELKARRGQLVETWAALRHQLDEAEANAARLRAQLERAWGAIEELDEVRKIIEPVLNEGKV